MFLLAAVAAAELRGRIRRSELTADVLMRVNYVIRCPDPSMFISL
jgi:hypothetical protein